MKRHRASFVLLILSLLSLANFAQGQLGGGFHPSPWVVPQQLQLYSTAQLQWGSGSYGTTDLILARDAADILAQRNNTNAQQFNLYNTFTDASNYERLDVSWKVSSNIAILRTKAAGTGTFRALLLGYSGSTSSVGALFIPSGTAASITLAGAGTGDVTGGHVSIAPATSTGTSGTSTLLNIQRTYAPTATSTLLAIPLRIVPTINYSNVTPGAGSYEALKIAVTETALPTGQNYLIRASAGVAGTTDMFAIRNNGVPEFKGTNSTGAGTALLGTNSPAGTLSAPYTWMTVITADGSTGFIPIWK